METWYLIKVKFTKEFQDGTLKRVTEAFLVSAMSFTEAEARIYEEVGEFIRGEFIVQSIAKQEFADIFFFDDSDVWFKCKVGYVSEDEDSGKEKKFSVDFLVSAKTVDEANSRVTDSLAGLMISYEVSKVEKTNIMEVYPYIPNDSEEGEMELEIELDDNVIDTLLDIKD